MRPLVPLLGPWIVLLAVALPHRLLAGDEEQALTLDAALREARESNAQLPVSKIRLQGALSRAEQARGALRPTLSLDGDIHGGSPTEYASGDALVRALVEAPIYEGGELRAARDRAEAEAEAARAGYRVAARELDYAVRTAFDRVLRAERDLAFREAALDRLRGYLSVVQARQASGQGLGADVLRTRQRVAAGGADVANLTRELHEAQMEMNDLLGREPDAPLRLVPLPEPGPPAESTGQPWLETPDVSRSESQIRSAEAGVQEARAGRRLHLSVEADAGAQPKFGPNEAPLNNGEGWGAEVTVLFSLPLWDGGLHRGRMAEARSALDEVHQEDLVVRRVLRLAWTRAATELEDLYREVQERDRTVSLARDAYLQAESLYRGGQGSALEVLDAYDAWVQADRDRLDAVYEYRVAQASLLRWGTP